MEISPFVMVNIRLRLKKGRLRRLIVRGRRPADPVELPLGSATHKQLMLNILGLNSVRHFRALGGM
jgi:hypothetical protein